MKAEQRRELALWRYSILGPIVSARLEHGDRKQYFADAAERTYQHPSGRTVRLSARTIEDWYYAWLAHGLAGLEPKTRSDAGTTKLDEALCELLCRAKREKPRRSIRRIITILERAKRVPKGTLTRSTVHRVLARAGLGGRPSRAQTKERRSFLVDHGGDLWMGDALHGPRVLTPYGLRKSYMLSIMDAATRAIVRSAFFLAEGAVEHERLFIEALRIYGRPRTYYVDRGAAYMAESLALGCAELGIHLLHTEPRDCQAKGAIERWHRTWREEVGDELPAAPLSLDELNAKHWAWLGAEYHARTHATTGRKPLEHFLAETEHHRPLPRDLDVTDVFLRRERRKVRADGTVRLYGRVFEVAYQLPGQWVELRLHPVDPHHRPRVFVDDQLVGEATPIDLHRNATRRRHRARPHTQHETTTGLDPLGDLEREHYHVDDDNED